MDFDFISFFLLGLVQGIVEFLPISSSGHLVVLKSLLGLDLMIAEDGILELWLHMGTLFSILLYFRKRIFLLGKEFLLGGEGRRTTLFLCVATIPVILAYALAKEVFQTTYQKPVLVGLFFLINGAILWIAVSGKKPSARFLSLGIVLLIGFSQVFALFPGISRSGITISTALILGLSLPVALEFSFFLLLFLLGGASVLNFSEFALLFQSEMFSLYLVSFFASFVGGLASIHWILSFVRNIHWKGFAWYCFILGGGVFAYFAFLQNLTS